MNPPPTATADAAPATALHPLAPLRPDEIGAAAQILKRERGMGPEARFVFISLHEPAKDLVRGWAPGADVPREAHIVVRDRSDFTTNEAVVSLSDDALVSYETMEGLQAPMLFEEFMAAEETVCADPRWQEAMRRRGVEDLSLAMLDPWPSGYLAPEDHPAARRIIRPLTWVRDQPGGNGYARPVEGLVTVLDLDAMEVVEVIDHGVVPLPPQPGNYTPELMTEDNVPAWSGPREDLKPIDITQPQGASFTVDEGNLVEWQKWKLRVGFTPREGLVLHQVSYTDRGVERPILYRGSLSEMHIPYGDPAPTHVLKNVFDMGEVGIGWLANPLELGCDCLGDITYLSGWVNDNDGNAMEIPNAVCMHEEDYGIGWKHTDFRTEEVEVRRLRRLVVSFIATVGNYEYGYFWYLYTDGTIEYEVKLSGILSTGAIAPGEEPKHGVLLAPGLVAPHHQHFFCVRLDMEVDGPANRVVEVDSEPLPWGPDNPAGNAWVTKKTVLATEQAAQRRMDLERARFWRIESSEAMNGLGQPTAYKLEPGANTMPMAHPAGAHGPRGAFAYKHLWVTPYADGERYAAGDYPAQHPGGQGLPAWTAADRNVADTDLVVWYTFGAHHIARPEDWPVMPVQHIGFKLKPTGFFDGNPALDMPRSAASTHCHHHA